MKLLGEALIMSTATREFFETLLRLIQTNSNAFLFATTREGHAAMVAIAQGEIQALRHGTLSGQSALSLIATMQVSDYSVRDGLLPQRPPSNLPQTAEILQAWSAQIDPQWFQAQAPEVVQAIAPELSNSIPLAETREPVPELEQPEVQKQTVLETQDDVDTPESQPPDTMIQMTYRGSTISQSVNLPAPVADSHSTDEPGPTRIYRGRKY